MLNWRRDPGYEQSIVLHEWRMKQLANEIEQIENETKQIERETEQIVREDRKSTRLNSSHRT